VLHASAEQRLELRLEQRLDQRLRGIEEATE
jgi:hypothetical protein